MEFSVLKTLLEKPDRLAAYGACSKDKDSRRTDRAIDTPVLQALATRRFGAACRPTLEV